MIEMTCVKCEGILFKKDDNGGTIPGTFPKTLSDDNGLYCLCPTCNAKYRFFDSQTVNGQTKFSLELEE